MNIQSRIEPERGCGYRKQGGLYLVGGRLSAPCGKLPIPLGVCPCCNAGVKFARGFTWIGHQLIEGAVCAFDASKCKDCSPFSDDFKAEKHGLMWVGEKFYPMPSDFIKEGNMAGISKRISTVPKDLVIGKTWILLAHRKAVIKYSSFEEQKNGADPVTYSQGIFAAFMPERIEYVVHDEDTPEKLESMEKRGITLIKVIKDTTTQLPLPEKKKRKPRKKKIEIDLTAFGE